MSGAFSVKVRPFITPTVTGSLLIANPVADAKAAMVVLFGHTAASVGVETANAVFCIGLTDGTRSRYMAGTAQDNVDPGNSYRSQGSNHLLFHIGVGGAASLVGDLVTLDETGLTINFTTVPGVAMDGFVVFWNGPWVQAYVGDTGSLGSADNTTTVITDPGFRSNSMIMMGAEVPVDGTISADLAYSLAIGGLDRLGTAPDAYVPPYPPIWPDWTQVVTSFTVADGASKGGALSTGWALLANYRKDASRNYRAYMSDLSSSGFSLTTVGNAHNAVASYLALKLGSGDTNDELSFSLTRNPGILDLSGFTQAPAIGGAQELDLVGATGTTYAVLCLNTGAPDLNNTGFSSSNPRNPMGIGVSAFDMDGRSAAANFRVKWVNNGTLTDTACIQTDAAIRTDQGGSDTAFSSADFLSYDELTASLQVNWTTVYDEDPPFPLQSFGYIQYAEDPASVVEVEPTVDMIGGTNFMLDTTAWNEFISPSTPLKRRILPTTHTGSEIHIGPFRYPEQKHADETASVDSLIVGVSESRNGEPVEEADWLDNGEAETVDFGGDGSDDEEHEYDDWGYIPGFPDVFDVELMNTDDGRAPQFQGVEPLTAVEEFDASRKFESSGMSAIMHRLRFFTSEVGHKFYIKAIDIAGLLTGRHR